MKKKKETFPLVLHGAVSLLLPIPCFLIMFVLNAFLAVLVPGSAEATGGTSFISILPMLFAPAFSLSGIYRAIRLLLRSKKGGKRFMKCIACIAMCALALAAFIALMVFGLRY